MRHFVSTLSVYKDVRSNVIMENIIKTKPILIFESRLVTPSHASARLKLKTEHSRFSLLVKPSQGWSRFPGVKPMPRTNQLAFSLSRSYDHTHGI